MASRICRVLAIHAFAGAEAIGPSSTITMVSSGGYASVTSRARVCAAEGGTPPSRARPPRCPFAPLSPHDLPDPPGGLEGQATRFGLQHQLGHRAQHVRVVAAEEHGGHHRGLPHVDLVADLLLRTDQADL